MVQVKSAIYRSDGTRASAGLRCGTPVREGRRHCLLLPRWLSAENVEVARKPRRVMWVVALPPRMAHA